MCTVNVRCYFGRRQKGVSVYEDKGGMAQNLSRLDRRQLRTARIINEIKYAVRLYLLIQQHFSIHMKAESTEISKK